MASNTPDDGHGPHTPSRPRSSTMIRLPNFLSSPIWGLAGKLSWRQKQDVQKAKDARLAAAGEVDTGPPKHVLEGHADKQDLLGWGTNVCARGRQDQKWAEEDLRRQFSPLKKMDPHDYVAAFDKENLEARKESEHIWENAREKAQRKRREREKALREFKPKDVTPGKKKHDSGVGQLTDGEIAKISAEMEMEEAEKVREDMRRVAERIRNNDMEYSGETLKTRIARERLCSTVGMSMADMKAEINDIKGVADTPDMDQLRDLRRSNLDKPEIQRMTYNIDKEIPLTIKKEKEAPVVLPTTKNVAGMHGKEVDDESTATPDIPAIEDMMSKQPKGAQEHIIKNIGEMQDIQDETPKRNSTASKHDDMKAKLVRGDSENIVDGMVQANIPDHPPLPQMNPDGTAVELPAARSSRSPKRGSVITSLAGPADGVKVVEKEVKPSETPVVEDTTFGKGDKGEEARMFDNVSPKSQARDTPTSNPDVKTEEANKELHQPKPASETRTNSSSSEKSKIHKWAKGKESEEACMEVGVSPKSVRVGSAVMSVDALGYGDSVDGKDEGLFGVKKGEDGDAEEKDRLEEAEKRTCERAHGTEEKERDGKKEEKEKNDKGKKNSESQDKTNTDDPRKENKVEKWAKGKEGEEARMAGGISPKSTRVGSGILNFDENKGYGTASENGGDMMSAKSKLEQPEEMKLDGGEGSKQDVQENIEESK